MELQRHSVAILCVLSCFLTLGMSYPDPRQREELIKMEASMRIGGNVSLSPEEQQLDAHLSKLMLEEMAREDFLPALHFFKARPLIRSSPIYGLLQKMPKGAALHVHDFAMVDVEWLVRNVTYRPHCYICYTDDRSVRFYFSSGLPKPLSNCSTWTLLEQLRAKTVNVTDLDDSLMSYMTLWTLEDPELAYPSLTVVWKRFEQAFKATWGLVTYAPVFKDYFHEGLLQFYRDNILYVEVRALLPETYELDGSTHDTEWTMKTYQDTARQFVEENPDFFGARVIFTVNREIYPALLTKEVQKAMKLQVDFPETMAGFDLVGQEDTGRPLWEYKEALSLPASQGSNLSYFFHAGETDLQGTKSDQNMLDALLFNTSRIGHGFALLRHPVAKMLSKMNAVPLEVCPISNQVLKLVKDLRNHPAAALMSEGHPLVISSDDPSMFGASGLSDDFYEAFVGFGGLSNHLGTLKELAMNSIRYSSLPPNLQEKAMALWQRKWNKFVTENL
ncbi:adenosine deaminase 2-A [Gadus chalcogrammus]|uniref:adenosine deaminase 2-A n=1 Tax=Gadus chalcogrammus TaxID=1042646 RepID=UPI0024C4D130|nr:adenosine deaminase 2-A [Gadus chalcogrammus]XP_056455148.1 adenosine deaminase 2-A [Gadus chalcogrammus]